MVLPTSAPAGASSITDKQAQARQIADKLDQLNSQLMALASQSEVARQRLAQAQHGVEEARKQADQANAQVDQAKAELSAFAVKAYMSGSDSQSLDLILSSAPGDSSVKSGYAQSLTGNRVDLLDRLASTEQRAKEEGDRLHAEADSAKAESDKIDAAQRDADAAVAEQTNLKTQVDGELAGLIAAEQQRRAATAAAAAVSASQAQVASTVRGPVAVPAPASGPTLGPVSSPSPAPAPPPGPAPAPNGGAGAAVAAALSKIGSPYVWGAAGPNAFDCSGLTMWAWAHAGVSLPHYTGSQLAVSRRISISELQPGDLVFVWGPGETGDPGHVGLYIGGGQMVHAPHTGAFVEVVSIYWWPGSRLEAGRVC
ncbi:MAG: NlpC/P60 family protein [Acidimicrobiales bacterium]